MPVTIARSEALERIKTERGDSPCLMCAIRDRAAGPVYAIYEDEAHLVMLPRYVRRWGQVMAIPKEHTTTFAEVDGEAWTKLNALVLRAARAAEKVMQPRRCYLASTGSSAGELVQSSTHLHVHVIPLHEPDDKPADIFSWTNGVLVADEGEWNELLERYRSAF